jgi:hypothetical protein
MEQGISDILDGIRELRARAAQKLSGNEYYMIVQQLDALAMSAGQNEDMKSALSEIEARLDHSRPDGHGQEAPVVVLPRAGSFGGASSTRAIGGDHAAAPAAPPEPAAGPEADASLKSGLALAAEAVHPVVEAQLSGNSYYMAAYLVERLRHLPAPKLADAPAVASPADLNAALGLLRAEMEQLSGLVRDEAVYLVTAFENLIAPKAPPAPAPEPVKEQAAPAAPQPATQAPCAAQPQPAETAPPSAPEPSAPRHDVLADASGPEPDAGPKTGFDQLAEAAWQRVKSVSEADRPQAPALNGSAVPMPSATLASPQPAPAAPPPPAAPLTEDMSEALNDGGSERRSSEPCYAAEFEPAFAQPAASGDVQPAVEAVAGQEAEAPGEAAAPAEAESVAAAAEPVPEAVEAEAQPAETAAEPKALEMLVETVEVVEMAEGIAAVEVTETVVTIEAAATEEAVVITAEPIVDVIAVVDTAADGAPVVAILAEAAPVAEPEAAETAPEGAERAETKAEPKKTSSQTPRGGFFSRLFGSGRGAEFR